MMNNPYVEADFPWTSIDREAVLTYTDTATQQSPPVSARLRRANEAISLLARKCGWSPPSIRPAANELDQIAISKNGKELVLIELKPKNGNSAFYAPLQLARYGLEWALALSGPDKATLVTDLNAVADARRRSGLIYPVTSVIDTPVIRPIIGFNEAPTPEVLRRMLFVWGAIAEFVRHPLMLRPEIWAWPDRGHPNKLHRL